MANPQPGNNSVTYAVVDDWGSGHTANMTVTAGHALNGWTVEFDSAAQITSIWNAQITSHVGTHYVITNMAYNGAVAAGQSTTFGYQATPGALAATPTNLKVNGVAVSTPPTTPSLSIADTTVAEGNTGTSNATFTVTLSKPSTTPVTVNYSTSNGTATARSDFTATTGTLTFAAGVTSQTINVKVTGDTTVEPDETFTVALSSPTGATISRATATGTITNDDVDDDAGDEHLRCVGDRARCGRHGTRFPAHLGQPDPRLARQAGTDLRSQLVRRGRLQRRAGRAVDPQLQRHDRPDVGPGIQHDSASRTPARCCTPPRRRRASTTR